MIKDIERPEVKDIAVAVVKEVNKEGADEWNVYLLNLKEEQIYNVLITSKGYGSIDEEKRQTSTLRQYFDDLPPKSFVKIEPIMEELFGLTNEFWVSFYIDKVIFDKKFIFLPETITKDNFTKIPLLKASGVLIK
jgi:hypothetical protein